MELVAACVGIADIAARSSSKIWRLTELWKDAPSEIHQLRDDLSYAQEFFGEVRFRATATRELAFRKPASQTQQLCGLLDQGSDILGELEVIIDGLGHPAADADDEPLLGDEPVAGMSKRRRVTWLLKRRRTHALRLRLKDLLNSICGQLMALNM
jgi:hypothetical protein